MTVDPGGGKHRELVAVTPSAAIPANIMRVKEMVIDEEELIKQRRERERERERERDVDCDCPAFSARHCNREIRIPLTNPESSESPRGPGSMDITSLTTTVGAHGAAQTFPDKTEARLGGKIDRRQTLNGQKETGDGSDARRWPTCMLRKETRVHLCSAPETMWHCSLRSSGLDDASPSDSRPDMENSFLPKSSPALREPPGEPKSNSFPSTSGKQLFILLAGEKGRKAPTPLWLSMLRVEQSRFGGVNCGCRWSREAGKSREAKVPDMGPWR
ncbi:hypothetical protein EYF80_000640 [Liparis tanakae]|uniref:Uncharacterized protein n=1 Tax=Liparis tanakae TaxID=230148 RepID=A0A4Z2JJF0_9TELE|nr:hypothetical protein EYF80_000640 [Liparis tanakae]